MYYFVLVTVNENSLWRTLGNRSGLTTLSIVQGSWVMHCFVVVTVSENRVWGTLGIEVG